VNIISWNIQAGKGVDGVIDLERIVKVVKQMGQGDIMCFQEVVRDEGTIETTEDQVTQLTSCFPEHHCVFGPAVDRLTNTGRIQFGNLVLSRLPVIYTTIHKLPQPADSSTKNMPRQAIEVVVSDKGCVYRIVTTHLEYFSATQCHAHVDYLCQLNRETIERVAFPSIEGGDGFYASGPETELNIFCGDFNLNVDSTDYQKLVGVKNGDRTEHGESYALHDAWRIAYPDTEHKPTCGIFDHDQWPEGAHCRDFFFVTTSLAGKVAGIKVDTETAASDHQPLMLTLT